MLRTTRRRLPHAIESLRRIQLDAPLRSTMSQPNREPQSLPPPTIAALLRLAAQAQQHGKHSEARKLLRGLVARQPGDPRIWLMLAMLAERRDEQRQLLRQVLELAPAHPLALRSLAELDRRDRPSAPPTTPPTPPAQPAIRLRPAHAAPPLTEPVRLSNSAPPEPPPPPALPQRPWLLLLSVAAALVFAISLVATNQRSSVAPTPTAALPGAVVALPATSTPTASATAVPTAPASATPVPSATAAPTAPIGRMLTRGIWNAGLLRPTDVVVIDGGIGELQPEGRFVLALVAISNTGNAPARIPPALVTLVDGNGQQYPPRSGASALYLATFGPGRGDLSVDAPVPPGGGNVSVPFIFDVPPSARDLRLSIADGALSWPLDRLPSMRINPSPTP